MYLDKWKTFSAKRFLNDWLTWPWSAIRIRTVAHTRCSILLPSSSGQLICILRIGPLLHILGPIAREVNINFFAGLGRFAFCLPSTLECDYSESISGVILGWLSTTSINVKRWARLKQNKRKVTLSFWTFDKQIAFGNLRDGPLENVQCFIFD